MWHQRDRRTERRTTRQTTGKVIPVCFSSLMPQKVPLSRRGSRNFGQGGGGGSNLPKKIDKQKKKKKKRTEGKGRTIQYQLYISIVEI